MMYQKTLSLFLTLLALMCSSKLLAQDKVAKAIIAKGDVVAVTKDGTEVKVTKGTWLSEGSLVTTKSKSFVKFLFKDKSQMNLGPNSEMKIAKFDNKEAGIINLMKGSLRSKVTKNYLKEKAAKSKLFIKTKTAAMGVRGTDFMVSYNPIYKVTSLDVISGQVAMAPLNNLNIANDISRSALEKIVSSKAAVLVNKGQMTSANEKTKRAPTPQQIPQGKLQKLKKTTVPFTSKVDSSIRKNPLTIFKVGNKVVKPLTSLTTNTGGEITEPAPENTLREPASTEEGTAEPDNTIIDPRITEDGTALSGDTLNPDSGTLTEFDSSLPPPPEDGERILLPPPPPPPDDGSYTGDYPPAGDGTSGGTVLDPCQLDPDACNAVLDPIDQINDPCVNDPSLCGGGTKTNVRVIIGQ